LTKQYFGLGYANISGGTSTPRFCVTNHLNSICEVTDSSSSVVAEYNYDPYGRVAKLQGSEDSDFQFCDYYCHSRSGLSLTCRRAYNSADGIWLSRDPQGESGGINLFRYVDNTPVRFADPSGLTWWSNANFAWQFSWGQGDNIRNYGPDSLETQELENSPPGSAIRNAFYNSGCKNITFDYGTWQAAWDTVLNPFTNQFGWNTATQVGGFANAKAKNNGDQTVTFTIVNVASLDSFLYHARTLWGFPISDNTSPDGNFRNITQTFTWTEKIDCPRCKK
jgi:RHS repeat-associated protein